jgi:type I restriction enzyme S subunit
MVPNGWEHKSFKQILKLDRGSSPRPIVNFVTDSDDGVNWIKIGDTKGEAAFINSTKQKITKEGAKKSRKVSKGEIILSNSMSYGKPYILNIDGFIHDGWFVIRHYEKNLDRDYLIQLLGGELVQRQYKRLAAGGVVSNINSELVYSVKVDIPPIPEQRKIATILGTWDNAINTTERLIDNSKQQKKALMQQLLTGKKRLLDDAGKVFEGEWEQVTIGSTSKCFSGGTPSRSKEEYYGGGIPWITSGKLNDRFVSSVNEYISELGLKNSSAKIVKNGSLLIAMYGATAGKVAINKLNGATVNQAVLALEPNKHCHNYFLFYLFEVEMVKALKLVQGGQPNLSAAIIKGIKIKLSSLTEQRKIAVILTNADKEVELLEQQCTHLKQEKKALMQQVLTGKRRVKLDNTEAV